MARRLANIDGVLTAGHDGTAQQIIYVDSDGLLRVGSVPGSAATIANGTNSTGAGIEMSGLIAQFDETSPTTVTENQFGNLRMSANGVLYVTAGTTSQWEFPFKASTELTRPSDTNIYAIGDAVANSTTAGSVTPLQFTVARANSFTGRVVGAQIITDSATAIGAIRLHLFNTTPFAAAGFQADNAALALTYAALTTGSAGSSPHYIGSIDFETFVAHTASARSIGQANQTELHFDCAAASQIIFGLLEARAAWTPASGQKFTVALDVVQG